MNLIVRKNVTLPWQERELSFCLQRKKGSGPDWLVLLHGLQANQHVFNEILTDPHFSGYSVLTLDLIGFGNSDKSHGFSYELTDQAQLISELLEKEKIRKFSIIGHSAGAMIGTLLLKMIPEKIKAFVSLEGNLVEKDCGESLKISSMNLTEFADSYERMKEDIAENGGVSGAKRAAWTRTIADHAFFRTAKSIVACSKTNQLLEIFNKASQPRLLIVGEKSHFHSRPEGPGITVRTVSDAGHFMLIEKPEATWALVHEFLTLASIN